MPAHARRCRVSQPVSHMRSANGWRLLVPAPLPAVSRPPPFGPSALAAIRPTVQALHPGNPAVNRRLLELVATSLSAPLLRVVIGRDHVFFSCATAAQDDSSHFTGTL